MAVIRQLDRLLLDDQPRPSLTGWRRGLAEFVWFGLKQLRACLFVGLFFLAVVVVPRDGLLGIARYDLLLLVALAIQGWMIAAKLESADEVKAICLFHLVGFALEVFKTSGAIQSWSYPDPGYSKLFGVPLFAGFMYAAVGSYVIQAWRMFNLQIHHHPRYWMATLIALAIYANFFSHHFVGDYRWYLAACALGLYARAVVHFTPLDRPRQMPLLLAFMLIGFFIWLAENISTFFGVWTYPNQLGAWATVHVSKWSSWSLLVIMMVTMVASLKHLRARVYIPE